MQRTQRKLGVKFSFQHNTYCTRAISVIAGKTYNGGGGDQVNPELKEKSHLQPKQLSEPSDTTI